MDGSFSKRPDLDAFDDRRRGVLEALGALGVLDELDTAHVASILRENRDPLDQIICKLGLATEDDLARAYGRVFSAPLWGETMRNTPNSPSQNTLNHALNRQFLFARRLAPVSIDDGAAIIAIVDPSDEEAIAGVAFALDCEMERSIVTASQFDRLFTQIFPETELTGAERDASDAASDISHLKEMASAEPVVRYVNRLIAEASRQRASDIHIEPMARQTLVRLRIDGRLADFDMLPGGQALSIVSRLKILADIDIAEQRRPQDGRMSFPVGGRAIDLRLSTTPTVNGESLVIRLLDQSRAPLELEGLGFDEKTRNQLHEWIAAPNGIVLLTGPTGSGKTTTLYSLLTLLATGDRKILTIEDPVEYKLAGVNQSQVNPAIGVTFANALRSFLRHDPDIIMVGEMRDAETARIAMRAAMTGHLVLSTLHTNDAASAVTRLLDMGVEDFLVASTLLGVVGQRLVRRICPACKGATGTDGAAPCAQCHGNGFLGRIVISETMRIDGAVRNEIKTGARAQIIAEAAQAQGFVTLLEDGRAKAAQNLTVMSEVNRAVGSYAD